MGRFRNTLTDVVVSVDDSKDDRYQDGWEPADKAAPAAKKTTARKASSSKSEN